MEYLSLNGTWKMHQIGLDTWHDALVPGSVYADLMRDHTLPDPFWRENELEFFDLMKNDFEYTKTFEVSDTFLKHKHVILQCQGLDTLACIIVNGTQVAETDNMHIEYRFDIKQYLHSGENRITIQFRSPIQYCLDKQKDQPMWGSTDAIPGFGYIRKAHMMFGWDWGPRLPDAGIWKPLGIQAFDVARINSIRIEQLHENGHVSLILHPELEGQYDLCTLHAECTTPDGCRLEFDSDGTLTIQTPKLWWPNGYGAHPLYSVQVKLDYGHETIDTWTARIGLRTLSISQDADQWGNEFCHIVNGVKIFAMGADYIPEDNIFSRITPERTRRLLEDAAMANFNTIRVWGGGYYPSDEFYDLCDELGLLVWQDLMFACSFYTLSPSFEESIRTEVTQNVKRIRNHASLALICGNNEMEQFMGVANHLLENGFDPQRDDYTTANTKRSHISDYIKMYEYILPSIVHEVTPQTFWWPSSPSSGGNFDVPQDPTRGDVHYWEVWHGEKPFTEYRKYQFRYVSEFGFQSFPCLKTVETFTLPSDRNIFSRIMERHQRNKSANGKILSYLSQTFRYPKDFDMLIYASQLLQAEAIRYGVEYWRRNRGCCMGAIIWQLNDCWPVASWSSIDSLGRWKALHYVAKRFFAPVMISIEEEGELSQNPHINEFLEKPIQAGVQMCLSNETMNEIHGTVYWALRDASGKALQEGSMELSIPALASKRMDRMLFPGISITDTYFSCEYRENGKVVTSSTALFCAPKHFNFMNPGLAVSADNNTITVQASAYARMIRLESDDPDLLLEDNYFDLNGGSRTIRVLRGSSDGIRACSVVDIS